jgi:hypothetical protein
MRVRIASWKRPAVRHHDLMSGVKCQFLPQTGVVEEVSYSLAEGKRIIRVALDNTRIRIRIPEDELLPMAGVQA